MALWLKTSAGDFEPRFRELLAAKRESAPDVEAAVAGIVAPAHCRGEGATVAFPDVRMSPKRTLRPAAFARPPDAARRQAAAIAA